MLIWPEVAAVSADGSTVCVLILRSNSSCSRSIALVVRAPRHWIGGRQAREGEEPVAGVLWNRRGRQYPSPAFVLRHGAGLQPPNVRGIHRLPNHGALPRCHEHGFAAFGGVPSKIMVDNLKSAVVQRLAGAAPVFNPRYLDFARHYGFAIEACNVAGGNEKGRASMEVITEPPPDISEWPPISLGPLRARGGAL
jgi:hypothetical protein